MLILAHLTYMDGVLLLDYLPLLPRFARALVLCAHPHTLNHHQPQFGEGAGHLAFFAAVDAGENCHRIAFFDVKLCHI